MLRRILKLIEPKWEELIRTQDIDSYMRVKSNLIEQNVNHKTKFNSYLSGGRSGARSPMTYVILVKKEDIHKAQQLMRHR